MYMGYEQQMTQVPKPVPYTQEPQMKFQPPDF